MSLTKKAPLRSSPKSVPANISASNARRRTKEGRMSSEKPFLPVGREVYGLPRLDHDRRLGAAAGVGGVVLAHADLDAASRRIPVGHDDSRRRLGIQKPHPLRAADIGGI